MSSSQPASARAEPVVPLIAGLVAVYGVSQFLRNSVGVIASDLGRELELSAGQIGLLSRTFFFSFAAAQIPVGIAIDRYGPKRTMLATTAVTPATPAKDHRQPIAAAEAASGAVATSVPSPARPIWRLVRAAKRWGGKRCA